MPATSPEPLVVRNRQTDAPTNVLKQTRLTETQAARTTRRALILLALLSGGALTVALGVITGELDGGNVLCAIATLGDRPGLTLALNLSYLIAITAGSSRPAVTVALLPAGIAAVSGVALIAFTAAFLLAVVVGPVAGIVLRTTGYRPTTPDR